jgi:predicted enzyme related to lactoylglutathione lyase
MIEGVRYVHTNLIARDWRRLASFYQAVFGCEIAPPVRDFAARAANRPGFGHIAFSVRSVPEARNDVLAAGGSPVGEIVTVKTATGTAITWCYVTDSEGNIIELQASS